MFVYQLISIDDDDCSLIKIYNLPFKSPLLIDLSEGLFFVYEEKN